MRASPINHVNFGPAFFAISGRAAFERGEGYVCRCLICAREVTAPMKFQGEPIWCLYCGMERGQVPMIEIPLGIEYSCGISKSECLMINGWIQEKDDIDQRLMTRAKKLGQVLEVF